MHRGRHLSGQNISRGCGGRISRKQSRSTLVFDEGAVNNFKRRVLDGHPTRVRYLWPWPERV